MYCTRDEALRYVVDLLYLLPADRDPYQHVQFNFPCFPSLIYQMCDLTNLTINASITDRLKALFDNWPEARTATAAMDLEQQQQQQQSQAVAALLGLMQ